MIHLLSLTGGVTRKTSSTATHRKGDEKETERGRETKKNLRAKIHENPGTKSLKRFGLTNSAVNKEYSPTL